MAGVAASSTADASLRHQAAELLGGQGEFLSVLYQVNFQVPVSIFELFLQYGKTKTLKRYLQKEAAAQAPENVQRVWAALCRQAPSEALSTLKKHFPVKGGGKTNSWIRALNESDFQPLLENADAQVRRQAFRAMSQLPGQTLPSPPPGKGPVR